MAAARRWTERGGTARGGTPRLLVATVLPLPQSHQQSSKQRQAPISAGETHGQEEKQKAGGAAHRPEMSPAAACVSGGGENCQQGDSRGKAIRDCWCLENKRRRRSDPAEAGASSKTMLLSMNSCPLRRYCGLIMSRAADEEGASTASW